jgi:hypothetical protein
MFFFFFFGACFLNLASPYKNREISVGMQFFSFEKIILECDWRAAPVHACFLLLLVVIFSFAFVNVNS